MADEKTTVGSKLLRLGPIEYAAAAFVLAGAGAFFVKMNDKIDGLVQTVPTIIEKQTQQGKDIDSLGRQVDKLTEEITGIRLREAEDRGRKEAQAK